MLSKKVFFLVVFLFLASCSGASSLDGPFLVSQVVDGDTLDVAEGRIRLSGINTPETGECYYEEAKEKLEELTLNKEVYLEGDVEDLDKYGRMLRYIYTNATFVNGYLVVEGYARVYDKYNATTSRYAELKVLEEQAKSEKKGIWNCTNPTEGCLYVASKYSHMYHTPDCKWAKRIKPENLICFHSEEELVGYTASQSC